MFAEYMRIIFYGLPFIIEYYINFTEKEKQTYFQILGSWY